MIDHGHKLRRRFIRRNYRKWPWTILAASFWVAILLLAFSPWGYA